MLKEFKEFAMRGNVVDMATGIIIGGAFGTIVKSLVDDVLMPPIGLLLGGVDFTNFFVVLKEGKTAAPYGALANAKAAGAVSINYGLFINAVISFLIVAFAIFMVINGMNSLRRQQDGGSRVAKLPVSAPALHLLLPFRPQKRKAKCWKEVGMPFLSF